ncbi:MAG: DUF937 domain-containing protein [Pseudomonadota bacterium]
MAGLLDLLTGAQAQPAKQQLSRQFGLSDDMTQQAMSALIPALAAGLKSNASKPGGVEALLGALNKGSHQKYIDEPNLLERPETQTDGNSILGHLLGSKEVSRAVAGRASEKTGLGDDLLKQMLPVLATMVMGSLAKKSEEPDTLSQLAGLLGGGQAQQAPQRSGLGGLLGGLLGGGQKQQSAQSDGLGMLGALFDADRDGSAMDDIFEMVLKQRR